MSEVSNTFRVLPPEQEEIRAKCFHPSGAFVEFTTDEVEQSIPDRFERIAALFPERIAITTRLRRYTYAELNSLANRIAHALLSLSERRGEAVALLFDNNMPFVATLLGVLKAGKIYLPLDPSLPFSRLGQILEDAQPSFLITNTKDLPMAQTLGGNRLYLLNFNEIDEKIPQENPRLPIAPASSAWIHYTSSDIGHPKGIVQNHRNILHWVRNYTNTLKLCYNDRLTSLFSPTTTGLMHDIFSALLNGASLHPFNIKDEGLARMAEWLRRHRITVYSSAPTVFRAFAETLTGKDTFCLLRLIKLSGEPVSRKDIQLFRARFAVTCSLVNHFVTSETGSISWHVLQNEIELDDHPIPVGYPVGNNEISLLDDAGNEIENGQIGEIAVKSSYLAPGFWRRPDLTRAVFTSSTGDQRIYRTGDLGRMLPDGCLLWLGRKDTQTKIRGYSIDTKEIELALLSQESIQAAIVTMRECLGGDPRLIAYVIPTGHPAPTATKLRQALAKVLPDYMVPSIFMILDEFPLAPNGKVNRRALPPPPSVRPQLDTPFVPPQSTVEHKLARIWMEVLSLDKVAPPRAKPVAPTTSSLDSLRFARDDPEPGATAKGRGPCRGVGVDDDFFDLGGDSLAAVRVVYEIDKTFHLKIPHKSLFQSSTIRTMGSVIAEHQKNNLDADNQKRISTKLLTLSRKEPATYTASPKRPFPFEDRQE